MYTYPSQQDIDGALRFLGTEPERAEPELRDKLARCLVKAAEAAGPRSVYRVLPVERSGSVLSLGGVLPLSGEDIAAHLTGCNEAALLAVTLGASSERLCMQAEARDMEEAVLLDACLSYLTERAAEREEAALRARFLEKGKHLTSRYSPGYGDWPLGVQAELIGLLDALRRIGLTVSESGLLLPRKSITALMGLSDTPRTGKQAGCAHCALRDKCRYRREGTSCEA